MIGSISYINCRSGCTAHSLSVEVLFNVSACPGKCGKLKTALVTKNISVLTMTYSAEGPVSFRTAETSLPAAAAVLQRRKGLPEVCAA